MHHANMSHRFVPLADAPTAAVLTSCASTKEADQIEACLVKPIHAAFVEVGDQARLMFATGWPDTDIGPYLKAFKRAIQRRSWQAVFDDNAARGYGFSQTSGQRKGQQR